MQLGHTAPGLSGDRDNRDTREHGGCEELADLFGDELDHLVVHEVDFGQRHRSPGHAHQADHIEVFAGLRHDTLVGSDDQQCEIDPRGPCNHRVD